MSPGPRREYALGSLAAAASIGALIATVGALVGGHAATGVILSTAATFGVLGLGLAGLIGSGRRFSSEERDEERRTEPDKPVEHATVWTRLKNFLS
jgi:hypothetical protein